MSFGVRERVNVYFNHVFNQAFNLVHSSLLWVYVSLHAFLFSTFRLYLDNVHFPSIPTYLLLCSCCPITNYIANEKWRVDTA